MLGLSVFFEFLVGHHHWRDLNFFWGHRARTADLLELLRLEISIYFWDKCNLEAEVAVLFVGCSVAWMKAVSLLALLLGWAALK